MDGKSGYKSKVVLRKIRILHMMTGMTLTLTLTLTFKSKSVISVKLHEFYMISPKLKAFDRVCLVFSSQFPDLNIRVMMTIAMNST